MKKIFFALALCLICSPAFAEDTDSTDFTKGIQAATDGEPELNVPPATRKQVETSGQFKKIMGLTGKDVKRSEEAAKLRPKAVREVAERVGFQEGYLYRYAQIANVLKSREMALDRLFDFSPILLENGKVMPPVITRADAYSEIKSPNEMVSTGTTFRLIRPARFVTVKPSWRDYLLVPEGAIRPEKIHPAMLPSNSEERKIWKETVAEQWFNGMNYANKMFQIGVNKLLVDMRGAIQFLILNREGYISMPMISKGSLAMRVGDENLEFNQETFKITQKAKFGTPKQKQQERKSRSKRKKK